MKYVIEKKTNNEWECLGEYNDKEQAITAMNIINDKKLKSRVAKLGSSQLNAPGSNRYLFIK